MVTTVHYECAYNDLADTFAKWKILFTEKLTNGDLVTTIPGLYTFSLHESAVCVCNVGNFFSIQRIAQLHGHRRQPRGLRDNWPVNMLAHSAALLMIPGVFCTGKFIYNISFMIRLSSNLQLQYGGCGQLENHIFNSLALSAVFWWIGFFLPPNWRWKMFWCFHIIIGASLILTIIMAIMMIILIKIIMVMIMIMIIMIYEIINPFPNCNGCIVEVWKWISVIIRHPHFMMDDISHPCRF